MHTLIHPTILTRTSTYNIKNSFEVLKDLKELHIPENALHFAADAKLMYTNIDTANGIIYRYINILIMMSNYYYYYLY